jgi:uncharacterized protein YydD (DUF2326 family)
LVEQGQPIANQAVTNFLNQLKQMTVKIPLLDAIKQLPIYTKAIKEACIKKKGRKKKDPKTIHFLIQLSDMMLENMIVPKYSNPGSLVVTVTIHGMQIQNALVDLGASINVMKKEVLSQHHVIGL